MPKRVAAKKKTPFGADLIKDMKLVLAHQRGEIELEQVWPTPVDVKAGWKRAVARACLTVIAKEPAVVRRALASE